MKRPRKGQEIRVYTKGSHIHQGVVTQVDRDHFQLRTSDAREILLATKWVSRFDVIWEPVHDAKG